MPARTPQRQGQAFLLPVLTFEPYGNGDGNGLSLCDNGQALITFNDVALLPVLPY